MIHIFVNVKICPCVHACMHKVVNEVVTEHGCWGWEHRDTWAESGRRQRVGKERTRKANWTLSPALVPSLPELHLHCLLLPWTVAGCSAVFSLQYVNLIPLKVGTQPMLLLCWHRTARQRWTQDQWQRSWFGPATLGIPSDSQHTLQYSGIQPSLFSFEVWVKY